MNKNTAVAKLPIRTVVRASPKAVIKPTIAFVKPEARFTPTIEVAAEPIMLTPQPIIESEREIPVEEARLRALKEIQLEKHRALADRQRTADQEHAALQLRIKRQNESLQNKDYTYDHKGNVILIRKAPLGKTPTSSHSVAFTVKEASSYDVTDKRVTLKRSPRSKVSPRPRIKIQNQYNDQKSLFVRNAVQQMDMFETINLAGGVTLTQGEKTKTGGHHPSSAYQLKRPRISNTEGSIQMCGVRTTLAESNKQNEFNFPPTPQSSAKRPNTSQPGTRRRTVQEIIDSIPDIVEEAFVAHQSIPVMSIHADENDSQVIQQENRVMRHSANGFNGHMREVSTAHGRARSQPAGSKLPRKPTARQWVGTHGYKARNPRDRPFGGKRMTRVGHKTVTTLPGLFNGTKI